MSQSQAIEQTELAEQAVAKPKQKRHMLNMAWQPFLKFKLLSFMLGVTVVAAVILGAFLYIAFSEIMNTVALETGGRSTYMQTIDSQLLLMFRYSAALFALYIFLLAAVCVSYTHRLIGPFRPFTRMVDNMNEGNYSDRVKLRKDDLDFFSEFGEKLNKLAEKMEENDKGGK